MTNERLDFLRNKASMLPRTPGVYIMKNQSGKIIYVGKSRSLRDRVSQYFHLSPDANVKTVRMVSQIFDFETIFCDTELEALALENVKIKQYTPKYNILLKDSKSYPYIKLTTNELYPKMSMVRKRTSDGAKYFGPYSSAGVVYGIINTVEKTFRIPTCKRNFPRDIGKERPCIYKQLGRCVAPCDNTISQEEYYKLMGCVADVLRGNVKGAVDNLQHQMIEYAKNEKYESAAICRDGIDALKKLQDKQKVVGSPDDEYDIISTYSNDVATCISVFYIRSGVIMDSDNFIYGAYEITNSSEYEYMTHFITELYTKREFIPREIYLGFNLDTKEIELVQEYLKNLSQHNVKIKIPQKGNTKKLCDMVTKNAIEQASIYRTEAEKDTKVLVKLASLLSLAVVPTRIEAYDISNLGNEHITSGMIVVENGKLQKSEYRFFKIKDQQGADDYSAMRETIKRRLLHLASDTTGSFSKEPDLILLDGGMAHVGVVKKLLSEMGIFIPVFGMVKDEHHKTRTLVTENKEISIAKEQSVFVFLYKIQEEVHKFTVSKMENSKRKTLKKSSLESISGIGPRKAKALMQQFKTIGAIKNASFDELMQVKGISKTDAQNIINYFKE